MSTRRLVLILLLPLLAREAPASGRTEDLEGANRLYAAGEFDEAARLLDGLIRDGRLDRERTALAQFNRGSALYRDEKFAQARDAYESAALGTRVLGVEAKATYNIGNSFFREAERRIAEGNLDQAAKLLESALAAYRRALELDPEHRDAATNLEVARTVLKGIRDELAKYGDLRELQQEIARELRALIAGQTRILQENETPQVSTADVMAAQQTLRDRTRRLLGRYDTLLQRLQQVQGPGQTSNPYTESRRHVVQSETFQGRALGVLETGDRNAASSPQASSLEELEKALELITPPQEEDRDKGGDGAQESGQPDEAPQDQGGGQSQSTPPSPEGGQGGARNGEEAGESGSSGAAAPTERPEDVLREEGELRRARESGLDARGGVDRDW